MNPHRSFLINNTSFVINNGEQLFTASDGITLLLLTVIVYHFRNVSKLYLIVFVRHINNIFKSIVGQFFKEDINNIIKM